MPRSPRGGFDMPARADAGLRGLRRNQAVDAGAEIAEDEILLGGGFAVIDFLGPLLQRQLDSEGLVDGEGNIEKIEAVDAEIIDSMAVRLDRVARNVARRRDDVGDLVENVGTVF